MSRLTELIAQAKAKDPQMGADLEREFRALSSRRAFGLNFERHKPEVVELPNRPVRKGDKVRILPERGSTKKGDQQLWQVLRVFKKEIPQTAKILLLGQPKSEPKKVKLADLIVIAEFRDFIYPGLVSTGKIERGGGKPFHSVINGENYHVLKALTYTHRGQVDAIFIDPPYNTGAKDWKYNNDYVEEEDLYRHSKWLAFIERRLKLVCDLLNPRNSVLIITIDEKEYLRLGLLLEQLFPGQSIQMVSSVINPSGASRSKGFSRADEYLYFVFFGDADISPSHSDMLRDNVEALEVRWDGLIRTGSESDRSDRPNMFYPIYFYESNGSFHSVGEPIPADADRATVKPPDGCFALFPITGNRERRWRLGHLTTAQAFEKGYIRLGPWKSGQQRRTLYYLPAGTQKLIEAGKIVPTGRDLDGSLILPAHKRLVRPMSVWNRPSHSATDYGSTPLGRILPDRKFPFPKSLYAVEDALRFFVSDNPRAVILDFFAGSGTTAHAVMRLNRQDGGNRQCISITNNEVAAAEQLSLAKEGLRPGDPDWEQLGICDYITKPRVQSVITGLTPEGEPIKGEYKFTDEFPMADGFEENAEFFTLTYEAALPVSHNRAFKKIAPLLWLKAGSQGERIDVVSDKGWEVVEKYGVLFDLDTSTAFCKAIKESTVNIAYIVTNDDRRFQAIAKRLPGSVEPVRLYESYLNNFKISSGE